MGVSVVIVSYRPDEWLEKAIRSVLEEADEVVVVDNGSLDHVASDVATSLGARVVRSPVNRGFAGGVNVGIRAATQDVIAILNDDAVAAPGWLDEAQATLTSRDAPGVVGPKILLSGRYAALRFDDETWFSPGDPRPLGRQLRSIVVAGRDMLSEAIGGIHRVETDGAGDRWRWTHGPDEIYVPLPPNTPGGIVVNGEPTEPARVVALVNNAGTYLSLEGFGGDYGSDTPDDGQFDDRRHCFGACGAALVTTRDVLARVGLFEERFFVYYEDLDWSWRVRLAGFEIVYDPAAVVHHRRGATSGGEAARRTRHLAALNRIETLARNAPVAVMATQVRKTMTASNTAVGRPRHAAVRVGRGLAMRAGLARRRTLRPREVWERWAGLGENWVHHGRATDPRRTPPELRFDD